MKIGFVVGGSYKGFYINHLNECKDLDILVFQEGLLYEYDYYNENFGAKTVTKEILNLSKKLHCKIFAKIKTNLLGNLKNEILYCDGEKVTIICPERYIKILINKKSVIFTLKNVLFDCADIFITLIKNRLEIKNNKKYRHKNTFLCDKRGVDYVKNGRMIRKFRKFCYFSLNF